MHGGFDSILEELIHVSRRSCIGKGYNCLTFEGPGQGGVIRKNKIPFRFDWEKVVMPVLDYALDRNEVDEQRIGLMGISMGGYLAARTSFF